MPVRGGAFDIVVFFDVLEHVPDPVRAIGEIARVLKPGGIVHGLVPCEGQPLTLHWAMWRLNVLADLKERHGGHIQRFTHGWISRELAAHGLRIERVSYSMHPVGQVRDVLTYTQREPWFDRLKLQNPVFRAGMKGLWALAFAEAQLLSRVPASAVTMHLKATKIEGA
jgi:SAM-dependent methyltransferase